MTETCFMNSNILVVSLKCLFLWLQFRVDILFDVFKCCLVWYYSLESKENKARKVKEGSCSYFNELLKRTTCFADRAIYDIIKSQTAHLHVWNADQKTNLKKISPMSLTRGKGIRSVMYHLLLKKNNGKKTN